jgi:hypothetical protein
MSKLWEPKLKKNACNTPEWHNILVCVIVGESYVYSKEEESKLGTH